MVDTDMADMDTVGTGTVSKMIRRQLLIKERLNKTLFLNGKEKLDRKTFFT